MINKSCMEHLMNGKSIFNVEVHVVQAQYIQSEQVQLEQVGAAPVEPVGVRVE